MSRIVELETIPCLLPKRREWTQHGMEKTQGRRIILRVQSDEGLEGWGEATALPHWGGLSWRYYGETAETVAHLIHDLFAPAVLNANPLVPKSVMESLDRIIVGHPYAKATIEMALQDLRGKLCGQPVYRLLGGPVRNGVRIGHMIGIMEIDDALQEAQLSVEQDGITAFQTKGGTDATRDALLVEKLRSRLPSNVFLRLDANKGYGREPKQVANIVRRLEQAGVSAIEQPAASIEALAACRDAVSVPIIADEACWQAEDVLELWRAHAVDAVSVYVAKAGGIERAAETARVAAMVGFSCDVNGSLETGIGNAASMHVAMAAANATLPSIIPIPSTAERLLTHYAGRYWEDDLVSHGYSYDAGFLYLADAPGLGIEVDRERVDRYVEGARRLSRCS